MLTRRALTGVSHPAVIQSPGAKAAERLILSLDSEILMNTRDGNREVQVESRFQIVQSIRIVCLIDSLYQCRHVFLTVAHFKTMTSNLRIYTVGNLQQRVMAGRKKWSKAWLHFTKKDDNSASNNMCKMIMSDKGGNTSIILKHLSTQHRLKFEECHIFDTSAMAS